MAMTQKIVERLQELPESLQAEVLDFVEFLLKKTTDRSSRDEDRQWSKFSIESALKGMEDEPELYSEADLKERFL